MIRYKHIFLIGYSTESKESDLGTSRHMADLVRNWGNGLSPITSPSSPPVELIGCDGSQVFSPPFRWGSDMSPITPPTQPTIAPVSSVLDVMSDIPLVLTPKECSSAACWADISQITPKSATESGSSRTPTSAKFTGDPVYTDPLFDQFDSEINDYEMLSELRSQMPQRHASPDLPIDIGANSLDSTIEYGLPVCLEATTIPVRLMDTLAARWGSYVLKAEQRHVILACVNSKDILSVLPTGFGKSLTYQLPAADSHRLSLVVSPLIALMSDQVDDLAGRGIAAHALTNTTGKKATQKLFDLVAKGRVDVLYLSPERLLGDMDKDHGIFTALRACYVLGSLGYIVVDEAHCISEWGLDFRRKYRRLGELRCVSFCMDLFSALT